MNGVCNDMGTKRVYVPIESLCPSRWFYWSQSKSAWKLDNTMAIRCKGKLDNLCNTFLLEHITVAPMPVLVFI